MKPDEAGQDWVCYKFCLWSQLEGKFHNLTNKNNSVPRLPAWEGCAVRLWFPGQNQQNRELGSISNVCCGCGSGKQ